MTCATVVHTPQLELSQGHPHSGGAGQCQGAACPERREIGLYDSPVYSTEIFVSLKQKQKQKLFLY